MSPRVRVEEHEMNQLEWWLLHHKANVRYLCIRIKKLIDEPDNEEYREFFHNHFNATLVEFLRSTGIPNEEDKTPVIED